MRCARPACACWGRAPVTASGSTRSTSSRPIALVVGAEGKGMREAVARRCDGLFHIPQRGAVSSLNASVAAAIALYEAARQRGW